MKNLEIPRNRHKQFTSLLLNEGEVISRICRDGTNEILFQLSRYIIKDQKLPTYGLPVYGLFGFLNGEYHLLCASYTKEMIENEYAEFIAQYAA
jgi:hypothetical protein